MDSVRVFAPGSVSNLACGFDILGFAVDGPGDALTLRRSDEPGVRITRISGDGGRLPRAAEKNTAGVALLALLDAVGKRDLGLEIELEKQMPLASGLGSSAASSVAAVVAADALLELELSKRDLLRCALEGERLACGAAHADNAAPSLYGGLVLVRSTRELDIIGLPVPQGLCCALVRPHVEVATGEARALLSRSLDLDAAVTQWGNVAGLIAGLYESDLELVARSLVDVVAEPVRADRVPGFHAAKAAALDTGALGCSLSGSGPTVFALCSERRIAEGCVAAMRQAFSLRAGLESDGFVSTVGARGARLLEDP